MGEAGSHQTPRREHKHLDTNPGDGFLNLTPKAKATIAKIEKWGYIFCTSKETNKMNLLNGRKWLQTMSYLIKGLVPIILEKGMATHSSILAWRIPWTEEPGGLQSTGSQSWTRLRDSTNTSTHNAPLVLRR